MAASNRKEQTGMVQLNGTVEGKGNALVDNSLSFLSPFLPYIVFVYMCFASHMVLLRFYHDSSLFTSHVTSTHAGAHDDRHCERERVHMGVPERIGAQ